MIITSRGPRVQGDTTKQAPLRGLHFKSTTAALPALTTLNKRLIFLEREKSIGRLRTSRQPTTASRRRDRSLEFGRLLLGSRAANYVPFSSCWEKDTVAIGHDKFLVVLSVLIAVQASYVGLSLSSNVETSFGLQRRLLLGGAALSLAIGIWGMHFVGMLAAQLPTAVDYVVLPTLVSLFICVLVVGFAIFTASVQPRTVRSLAIAAFAMGVGIASMHYTGMRAIHASVHMNHASSFVVASFVVAIAASALAIWLAFGTTRRPPLLICAIVLGLAISGMHYTAMAGLSLHPNTAASTPSSPSSIAISTELLAIVVAVVVFVVSGLFMLTLVPDSAHSRVPNLDLGRDTGAPKFQRSEVSSHQIPASTTEIKSARTPAIPVPVAGQTLGEKVSLPVERHGVRISVPADEIFWIRANTHYTYVFDGRDSLFCPLSISQVEKELDTEDFIRVHRSHIVNVRRVTSLKRSGDNGIIELAGAGRRMVPVSRNKMADLRAKLAPEKCSSNSV
jgi:NO-binding membrane sensor protein with MHYT domain